MGDKLKPCPSCGWPMMTVLDEYDRPHHVCQRFSCGYEEMEVKKRVEVEPAEVVPTHASASPTKRVIASAAPSSSGKKTIVIHKSSVKAAVAKATPQVKWETVIEVVKPSHYRPRSDFRQESRPERPERRQYNADRPKERREFKKDDFSKSSFSSTRESSTGGTFADFIRASEERKRRDEEKRKNKK